MSPRVQTTGKHKSCSRPAELFYNSACKAVRDYAQRQGTLRNRVASELHSTRKGIAMYELGKVQDRNAGRVNWTALGRWGGLLGGSALAIFGLTRSSRWGLGLAAAGGALAYGGTRFETTPRQLEARSSILVNCPVTEAYQFWRHFENLPKFMSRLDDVRVSVNGHLTWTVVSGGSRLSWDTYIVNDRENQRIEWSSMPESPVSMEGSVEFRPAPADRGTVVELSTRFQAPGMGTRRMVGQFLGKFPSFLMRNDLRRFKALIETGEIPTIEGQTHGPRSMTAVVARLVDPTRPIRPEHRNLSVLRRSA